MIHKYCLIFFITNCYKIIFDDRDQVLNKFFKFIDDSLNQGGGVLVHSILG